MLLQDVVKLSAQIAYAVAVATELGHIARYATKAFIAMPTPTTANVSLIELSSPYGSLDVPDEVHMPTCTV